MPVQQERFPFCITAELLPEARQSAAAGEPVIAKKIVFHRSGRAVLDAEPVAVGAVAEFDLFRCRARKPLVEPQFGKDCGAGGQIAGGAVEQATGRFEAAAVQGAVAVMVAAEPAAVVRPRGAGEQVNLRRRHECPHQLLDPCRGLGGSRHRSKR